MSRPHFIPGRKKEIDAPTVNEAFKGSSFTCGALFAGIGGFCLGFEQAGFRTAWAVELDQFAVATYRRNLSHVRVLHKCVKDTSVALHKLEPVDVLHAGFPCQSFSQAGEKRGFDDPRGTLFYEIIRIVREFGPKKPKVLVLENAPFLRYGEGGAWYLALQRAIRKAGYWFRPENSRELSANELTPLPQQRTRLFMVALSMAAFRSGRFEFPSRRDTSPKQMRRYIDFDGHAEEELLPPTEN